MGDLFVHRFQFAFTVVYHYLFPQLTMDLALLIVLMKARGLRPDGERWNDAARFWIRIFGINFAVGVGTGISMEFQFGTNWARFSRYAGSVIGQTLVPVHARLSSSPPEKSQHGDGESDSTIVRSASRAHVRCGSRPPRRAEARLTCGACRRRVMPGIDLRPYS